MRLRWHDIDDQAVADGTYVVEVVAGVVVGLTAAPVGVGDLVVSVTDGVPYVMFDDDGSPVTEG